MKRGLLVILSLLIFSSFVQTICLAATDAGNPISLGAILPAGSLKYTIHEITDPTGAVWGGEVTGFNFGTLEEISDLSGVPLGVFASQGGKYFVVDLAVSGGAFPPSVPSVNVTFSATDGTTSPAGLWTRATMTYKQAVFQVGLPPLEIDNLGPTAYRLDSLVSIPSSTFSGGWARMYVGIVTNPLAANMPSGANVFTAVDAAQTYSGTIQFSGW